MNLLIPERSVERTPVKRSLSAPSSSWGGEGGYITSDLVDAVETRTARCARCCAHFQRQSWQNRPARLKAELDLGMEKTVIAQWRMSPLTTGLLVLVLVLVPPLRFSFGAD